MGVKKRPLWMTGVNMDPAKGHHFTAEQVQRQAEERKARAVPPSTDQAVSRILRVYKNATDREMEDGLAWYQTARQRCVELMESRPHIVKSVLHAAGIIAALSPQLSWEENVKRAMQLVAINDTHGTADRIQKAKHIMQGDNPYDVLFAKGTTNWKVRSFFMNIAFPDWSVDSPPTDLPAYVAEEPYFVTLDRHALGMIFDDRNITDVKPRFTRDEYNWARDAFALTAAELDGVLPHQLQAVTWVVWRSRRPLPTEEEAPRLFAPD